MKALAIFHGKSRWWKFRHVLVAVETSEGTVVVIDPAGGGLHPWAGGCDIDEVAEHYRDIGMTVVETEANPGGGLSRFTCVDVVKRVLGIRGMFILTPYQLYRRLI